MSISPVLEILRWCYLKIPFLSCLCNGLYYFKFVTEMVLVNFLYTRGRPQPHCTNSRILGLVLPGCLWVTYWSQQGSACSRITVVKPGEVAQCGCAFLVPSFKLLEIVFCFFFQSLISISVLDLIRESCENLEQRLFLCPIKTD